MESVSFIVITSTTMSKQSIILLSALQEVEDEEKIMAAIATELTHYSRVSVIRIRIIGNNVKQCKFRAARLQPLLPRRFGRAIRIVP